MSYERRFLAWNTERLQELDVLVANTNTSTTNTSNRSRIRLMPAHEAVLLQLPVERTLVVRECQSANRTATLDSIVHRLASTVTMICPPPKVFTVSTDEPCPRLEHLQNGTSVQHQGYTALEC